MLLIVIIGIKKKKVIKIQVVKTKELLDIACQTIAERLKELKSRITFAVLFQTHHSQRDTTALQNI